MRPLLPLVAWLGGCAATLGTPSVPHGFDEARVVATRPGLVTVQATHHGLDVIGARRTVRTDATGAVRWVHGAGDAATWRELDVEPTVTANGALAVAFGEDARELEAGRHARLVVLAPADAPARLAWQVAREDAPGLGSLRVLVDAHTGQVIERANLTRAAAGHRARVYPVSPAVGPRQEVVFEDLPVGATTLSDDEVSVLNCIDERTCQPVLTARGVRSVHHCELVPIARATAGGDFRGIAPPADDTDTEDAFAEVQAYAHVKTALAAFRTWFGDPDFRLANPLSVVVNMRPPNLATEASACTGDRAKPSSQLLIEDNAYFWPAGEVGPTALGDRVVLHQGTYADWAYDGEVVFHEVVHAVMHTTTDLGWSRRDALGLDPSPGGLHEGFSDYFAAAITGNPDLAAYAGSDEDGPKTMSTLDEAVGCDEILTGEEHDESRPWASALWAIRRSLRSQERRDRFDGALARVISALTVGDGFAEARDLVLAEFEVAIEQHIAAARLRGADAERERAFLVSAAAAFDARAVPDCNGRVLRVASGEAKASLNVKGPYSWQSQVRAGDPAPATMQFAIEVDEPTTALKVTIATSYALVDELRPANVPTEPELRARIRAGAPVAWRWRGPRGEATFDHEVPVTIRKTGARAGTAVLEAPLPAGTYYVQLVNLGADWGLEEVALHVAGADGKFDEAGAGGAAEGGCDAGVGGGGLGSVLVGLWAWSRRRRAPPRR